MNFINCSQICRFKMSERSKCVFHLCFFNCGGERLKKGEKRLKDSRVCLNLFILSRRRREEGAREKNECERSVWKIIFVNTVRESNAEEGGDEWVGGKLREWGGAIRREFPMLVSEWAFVIAGRERESSELGPSNDEMVILKWLKEEKGWRTNVKGELKRSHWGQFHHYHK